MEQFKWTPGGIHLLKTINDYIDSHGGRISLLRTIRDEESKSRSLQWRLSYASSASGGDKTRKKVMLKKGKLKRIFASPNIAGNYLGRDGYAIRSGATKGHRVNGWEVVYVKRKK